MNNKKQTLKRKTETRSGYKSQRLLDIPTRENNHEARASKSLTWRFRSDYLKKGHIIIYWAFSSCSLISNTANIQRMRTSSLKVHVHWAWTILCLLCVWSLGGNLRLGKHKNGCTPFLFQIYEKDIYLIIDTVMRDKCIFTMCKW